MRIQLLLFLLQQAVGAKAYSRTFGLSRAIGTAYRLGHDILLSNPNMYVERPVDLIRSSKQARCFWVSQVTCAHPWVTHLEKILWEPK